MYSPNSIFHIPSLKRRSNRFTLIELFVVISIIAIISIMLLPALNASRDKAFKISCTNSLKGLSTGMLQYTVQAPSGMKTKDTRALHPPPEDGPCGDRIIGYQIACGMCGETTLWRSLNKDNLKFSDYGFCCHRSFYEWGAGEYGSHEKLVEA